MLSRLVACLMAAFVVVVPAAPASAAVLFDPELTELPAEVRLPRWQQALAELVADGPKLDACLADVSQCPSARLMAWRSLIGELRDRPVQERLAAINRFVNAVPYVTDPVGYGTRDFWSGPWRFLQTSGDCEDYAIAKYASLRRLGIAARDMRIVVVEDVERGLAHALLAVRAGGRVWVLDNQSPSLMPASNPRYVPYYAVNEENRWLHRYPTAPAARARNVATPSAP